MTTNHSPIGQTSWSGDLCANLFCEVLYCFELLSLVMYFSLISNCYLFVYMYKIFCCHKSSSAIILNVWQTWILWWPNLYYEFSFLWGNHYQLKVFHTMLDSSKTRLCLTNDVNERVKCNWKFFFWNHYQLKVFHTVPDQYDNRRLGVKINILLLILHIINSRFPPGISESAPGDGYSCPLQHSSCVRVVVRYREEPISHHQAFVWHFLKETHVHFNDF